LEKGTREEKLQLGGMLITAGVMVLRTVISDFKIMQSVGLLFADEACRTQRRLGR
jgi:hypothetical protein